MELTNGEYLVSSIRGRKSLLKPPISRRLKAGSVVLAPGENVGEHTTSGREETIVVLSGTATVECAGERFMVPKQHIAYIPPETVHNVFNESGEQLEYLYITTALGENASDSHPHGDISHSH